MDDNSHATVVKLDDDLEENENEVLPATFYERTGHNIKKKHNIMQLDIEEFIDFIRKKNMKLNIQKSSVMRFNFSTKMDFFPKVEVEGEILQVVSVSKILGIMIKN